ncbi:hypothetical protein M231_02662 [Tremella mesenterica]|uniref:Yeast cell wall synthesis Kre9/Knh1-like N-terminal domain-containing protein n=1 Tax=Tremella mesenterica TaxID=5217 RepID=A0A4Q1BQD9_TREME|nr:hypothetical protein M231_02662 [Tremella mesenterica]
MLKFGITIAALALSLRPVLAGIYCTGPVASTKAVGGQTLNVSWADDGTAPFLKDIGATAIDIYTGSVNQQVWLQQLAASVDVSRTASITTTIDPKIGPDGDLSPLPVYQMPPSPRDHVGPKVDVLEAGMFERRETHEWIR